MVTEKAKKIRDLVNHPWQRELIIGNKIKWNKVCACMDVIQDTQLAINSFSELPEFTAENGGYLHLYGLLQAMFLQQDAIKHFSEGIFDKGIDWKTTHPKIYEIRELRNDAIGHPTKRGNNESFHYIARYSLENDFFKLASYYPKRDDSEYRDIDLSNLIKNHNKSISKILGELIKQMEKNKIEHKKKFKDQKLQDLVPENFNYLFSKIYQGNTNNYELTEMHFKIIKEAYQDIKKGINERYSSYQALSGVELKIDKLDHIFERLKTIIDQKELYKNKDAEIFLDALDDRFKEFEEMLKEIDQEFEIEPE